MLPNQTIPRKLSTWKAAAHCCVLNTGSMGQGPEMKKVSVKVEPGDTEYSVDALKIVAMQKAV